MPNLMDEKSLDIVLDVKVKVTVQLGSVLLPMRQVLELSPGAIVQLTQWIPVDVFHRALRLPQRSPNLPRDQRPDQTLH